MRAEIGPFRPGQLGRITQLINKTNLKIKLKEV